MHSDTFYTFDYYPVLLKIKKICLIHLSYLEYMLITNIWFSLFEHKHFWILIHEISIISVIVVSKSEGLAENLFPELCHLLGAVDQLGKIVAGEQVVGKPDEKETGGSGETGETSESVEISVTGDRYR